MWCSTQELAIVGNHPTLSPEKETERAKATIVGRGFWLEALTGWEGGACGNMSVDLSFLLPSDFLTILAIVWTQVETTGQRILGSLLSQAKEQGGEKKI